MKTKFTKGEWLIKNQQGWINIESQGIEICYLHGMDEDGATCKELFNDARLIAAAPDLYTALEELVFLHRHKYGLDGAFDTELVLAEKALKKARGEK